MLRAKAACYTGVTMTLSQSQKLSEPQFSHLHIHVLEGLNNFKNIVSIVTTGTHEWQGWNMTECDQCTPYTYGNSTWDVIKSCD